MLTLSHSFMQFFFVVFNILQMRQIIDVLNITGDWGLIKERRECFF